MTQTKANLKLRSPLRGWLGGKYQLASRIIDRIPEHTCYVEPFAGAAWVLFKKPQSKSEVLNDISYDVVNLYRCVQHHLDALLNTIEPTLVSRLEFQRLLRTPPDTLTDIQRAARFFYIDPPYYNCEDMYGKGIFSKADFEQLAKQLSNIKGKFLLSLNDRPEVREIFKAFNIESEQVRYSVTLGKGDMFGEVLISNF